MPGSARNWSGRLCGSIVVVEVALAIEQVDQLERAGSGAGEHVVVEAAPRLLPPREAEVRARRGEAAAAVSDRARADAVHGDEHDRRRSTRSHRERDPGATSRRALRAAQAASREHECKPPHRASSAIPKTRPSTPPRVRRLVVARDARAARTRSPTTTAAGTAAATRHAAPSSRSSDSANHAAQHDDRCDRAATRVREQQRDEPT